MGSCNLVIHLSGGSGGNNFLRQPFYGNPTFFTLEGLMFFLVRQRLETGNDIEKFIGNGHLPFLVELEP